MSVELAAGLIMGCLLLAIAMGIPVAFSLMGVGLIFALILLGPAGLRLMYTATWHIVSSETMLAIPLFIIMSVILEFSGIGSDLFEGAYKWFGGIKGGLAVATVLVCTLLAAITGSAATGVVIMGVLAIPEMYKRGYNKGLVLGCIPAAAALGPIIPPSIYMIIVAMMAEVSVGKAFMGGVFPGLLMSALFCVYILARSTLQPNYAPGVPKEERASWKEKFLLLRGALAPIILILAVLGTLYTGIATPTEAASIGAAGALLVSVIYRKLTWPRLKHALTSGFLLTCMIMWIAVGGTLFAGVLRASGVAKAINDIIVGLSLGPAGLISVMLVVALILGMVMDGLAIIMITIPIFVPVIMGAGIDTVYFVVIYTIAIVIGVLTPPFAMSLFQLKGVAPEEDIRDMYRAVIPFISLMVVVLFICVFFPEVVLWLPNRMIR